MHCNIDAKGKRIRLLYGILLLILGIALALLWAHHSASPLRWIVSIAVITAGAFAIFEARKGWCAIRAMGFRTPY
jgi:uncharacterized membrane protein